VINIRSTGFENVAALFHDNRIRKKCSIVTDLDAPFIDTTPNAGDTEELKQWKAYALRSQQSGERRRKKLDAYCTGNAWLKLCLAPHTFEVDFIAARNATAVVRTIPDVYSDPPTSALAKTELESGNIAAYGMRSLTMAGYVGKGWFAI